MFNPKDKHHLSVLSDKIDHDNEVLRPHLAARRLCVKMYTGNRFGVDPDGPDLENPLFKNNIHRYVVANMRRTMSSRPRMSISTKHDRLKGEAEIREELGNQRLGSMRIERTLRAMMLDAQFFMGFAFVGRAAERYVEIGGRHYPTGAPFARRISPDDMTFDTDAPADDELDCIGHYMYVPFDRVKNERMYKRTARARLTPDNRDDTPTDGRGEPTRTIFRGDTARNYDEIRDYIELLTLYLPKDRLLLVVPARDKTNVLRAVKWTGPNNGPYHMLRYIDVPDHVIGMGPAALLMALASADEQAFAKSAQQAARLKKFGVYQSAAEALRVKNVRDGEMIHLDNPASVGEKTTGGVDQVGMAWQIHTGQLFNEHADNLSLRLGYAAQSPTLGQDQLLANASGVTDQDMRERTQEVALNIMRDVLWYDFHSPDAQRIISRRIGDTDQEFTIPVNLEDLEGDFSLDFDYDIAAYSMHNPTPQEQASAMLQMLDRAAAMYPLLQQQMIDIDLRFFARKWGNLTGHHWMTELFRSSVSQQQQQPPTSEEVGAYKPANTNRTYTRRSEANPNAQPNARETMQQLMSSAGGRMGNNGSNGNGRGY